MTFCELTNLTRVDFLKEHPVLTISHHKLQGKIVNLQKPLAIIEKRKCGLKRKAAEPVQRAEQAEQKQDEPQYR